MDKNTVLSVSPDKGALILRHTTLRDAGMKVTSVLTLAEARFEIQMGRCGDLLICHRLPPKQADDIAKLYRRYCPEGRIVFVTESAEDNTAPKEVDIAIPESNEPQQLVQALRPH